MLIRFPQSYRTVVLSAIDRIAEIQLLIADKEMFVGSGPELDRLRAMSLIMSAVVDHLCYEDNEDPGMNENFLQELSNLIQIPL
jgi:hypothetical protein